MSALSTALQLQGGQAMGGEGSEECMVLGGGCLRRIKAMQCRVNM